MGRNDDRHVAPGEHFQPLEKFGFAAQIEMRRRFVEEKNLRPASWRARARWPGFALPKGGDPLPQSACRSQADAMPRTALRLPGGPLRESAHRSLLEGRGQYCREAYRRPGRCPGERSRSRAADPPARIGEDPRPQPGCSPRQPRSARSADGRPSSCLMDIVPLDDTLLVEGRIRPQDIAFIRADQDAIVEITAYDSQVYGSLKRKVERISADALEDPAQKGGEKGESFYRVIVRTDKNYLGTSDRPLPIIPGM